MIAERADKTKPNMGLTTWKDAPNGKILRTDITVAKNYMSDEELHKLRLAVSAFLDIAQARAEREIPTNTQQWLGIMDKYLDLNEYTNPNTCNYAPNTNVEIRTDYVPIRGIPIVRFI